MRTSLATADLQECDGKLEIIEETIYQCRIAMKNESSRQLLREQIVKMTAKQNAKTMQKHSFKLKQRGSRLRKATPNSLPESQSIGN